MGLRDLDAEQRELVEQNEPLWQRAYAIVTAQPELDVTDVFHALRNLGRTPTERLRRALLGGSFSYHPWG